MRAEQSRAEQSRAEQSRAEQSRARSMNLDLLRIMACVAVVSLHTLQKDLSIFNSTLYYMCGFAVPTFFMARGYILLNRGRVSYEYSVRKSCAVMRVVISWTVLVFVGRASLNFVQGGSESAFVLSFIRLVLKSLIQKGTLWHFWYFSALLIVYFCLPLISRVQRMHSRIWLVCLVIGCSIQLGSYIVGTPLQSYCIQTLRLWTWLQYFTLGGLLGRLPWKEGKETSKEKHTICLLAITVLIIIYQNIAGRYLLHNLYAEYFYDSIITVLWVVTVFTWVMRKTLTQKCSKIIRCLSQLTMGVYIIHPLIIRVTVHFLTVNSVLLSLPYFAAVLLSSALVALAISKIPVMQKLIEL